MIVPIVSLVTPGRIRPFIDRVFSCYDEKIEVKVEHKFHLKENENNGR